MDPVDRLAAYLAGDLGTAEADAVSEELARDPELRAQVAAMRRADDALGALRSPRPSDGFEERLREHLQPVVAEALRAGTPEGAAEPAGTETGGGTFDELANRRAARERRQSPRWAPALGGVAAAALAVVVMVNLPSGDDADVTSADAPADMDTAEDGMELFSDDADDEVAAEEAAPAPEGPLIVASDRSFDDADIEHLLDSPDLTGVTAQGWGPEQGAELSREWSAALGVSTPPDVALDAPDAEDLATEEAEEPATEADQAPLRSTGTREVTAADEEAVSRCLEALNGGAVDAIPAYVEFGTYEGEEVLVFGLVTVDPTTDAYTRTEVWVLSRDGCETRYWRQD